MFQNWPHYRKFEAHIPAKVILSRLNIIKFDKNHGCKTFVKIQSEKFKNEKIFRIRILKKILFANRQTPCTHRPREAKGKVDLPAAVSRRRNGSLGDHADLGFDAQLVVWRRVAGFGTRRMFEILGADVHCLPESPILSRSRRPANLEPSLYIRHSGHDRPVQQQSGGDPQSAILRHNRSLFSDFSQNIFVVYFVFMFCRCQHTQQIDRSRCLLYFVCRFYSRSIRIIAQIETRPLGSAPIPTEVLTRRRPSPTPVFNSLCPHLQSSLLYFFSELLCQVAPPKTCSSLPPNSITFMLSKIHQNLFAHVNFALSSLFNHLIFNLMVYKFRLPFRKARVGGTMWFFYF